MVKKSVVSGLLLLLAQASLAQVASSPTHVLGFRDFSNQAKIDQQFLAVPDARLAQEELKTLTAVPHVAASKEDYDTAVYVAGKFKAAGLDTQIVPLQGMAEHSPGCLCAGDER